MLAPAPWCQVEVGRLASGLDSAASDVMAALGLQKLLGGSREAGGPEALALDSRIRGSVSLLLVRAERRRRLELDRHARGGKQSLCKLPHRVGHDAGAEGRLRRARRRLQQGPGLPAEPGRRDRQRRLREQGHLAARPGRGRRRPAISPWPTGCIAIATPLSSAALAHLALGFAAMDRKATAQEILGLLEKRNLDDPATRRDAAAGRVALESFAGRTAGTLRLGHRRGLARSRPRPRNWSIGSWPIAPATAGPRKRRPAPRRWPCAAGSPTADFSRPSATS